MKKQKKASVTIRQLSLPKSCIATDIFEHYSGKEWSMLLDSAGEHRRDGRYDILVAEPIATITSTKQKSEVWQLTTQQVYISEGNPLTLLQGLIEQYCKDIYIPDDAPSDLPFLAGAMGYFGYDLGKRFEDLPNTNADEYKTPDMAVGIYSWSIIRDNKTKHVYLSSLDGYPSPSPIDIERIAEKAYCAPDFNLISPWQANMTKKEYEQKITKIAEYLVAGDCYQINLAQRFSALYTGNEWHAYKKLRVANGAPFSAFVRLPSSTILSISPERFLSVKGNTVQTKPIKGTRPRKDNSEEDLLQIKSLLASDKDQAENLMIVDLLRNDLSKHCQPGSIKVPKLFEIESFAAVHHLVSTVTGELGKNSRPLDILQGAFPGGSITGAPKIRAMQIIDELEPNNRSIYCGSIGYQGVRGDMDTNICIRTLLCEQSPEENKIYCWAGGGIVADSKFDEEYQESLDKVSKILPVLAAIN